MLSFQPNENIDEILSPNDRDGAKEMSLNRLTAAQLPLTFTWRDAITFRQCQNKNQTKSYPFDAILSSSRGTSHVDFHFFFILSVLTDSVVVVHRRGRERERETKKIEAPIQKNACLNGNSIHRKVHDLLQFTVIILRFGGWRKASNTLPHKIVVENVKVKEQNTKKKFERKKKNCEKQRKRKGRQRRKM